MDMDKIRQQINERQKKLLENYQSEFIEPEEKNSERTKGIVSYKVYK